jgi:hypothetical protein
LQKVVLRIPTMTDDKMKQKAMEAVADMYGKQRNQRHTP